jgi:hypothetical protein
MARHLMLVPDIYNNTLMKKGLPCPSKPRESLFYSKDPAAARWRARQADIDNDIAGLSRDLDADRMMADMDARGVDAKEQIKILKRYFKSRKPEAK